MKEPPPRGDVSPRMQRTNWTAIALIGGLLLLVLLIAYFATSRNPDQDKLTNTQVTTSAPASREKLCSSHSTYDAIKRELFRRAAQLRGNDQAAFDRLAGFAVVRMDNTVMESEDGATGAVNCSGSLSLDLPPGVAAAGGRRSLSTELDYGVGAGGEVALRNADAIIAQLATLSRVAEPPVTAPENNEVGPEGNAATPESASQQPGPPTSSPGRPSFDCSKAHTPGEIAVCSDSGLSALDLNMATQFRRAIGSASPEKQEILRQTGRRFYLYRDRCPNRQCIADAYLGRMREIRDIMEGSWQPPR